MLKTIAVGVLCLYIIVSLFIGGMFVYDHWGYRTDVLVRGAAEEALLWPMKLVDGLF